MKQLIAFRFFSALMAVAVVLAATGCDSLLDLEPQQSISEDRALETPQNVEAALGGAYDAISDADLYGGQYMMSPDLLADDGEVNWTGTFSQPAEFWNKNLTVDNSFVQTQWTDAYDAINIANNVLSALDVFEDEDRRRRVEGEARFIRGALYFELARLFGAPWNAGDPSSNLAVPLVLEPTREINEEDNVERASVAAVYAQAIDDLTTAREQLTEDNSFYADTYVASAMLSRVYLMQGEYEAAAQEASRVIESGNYSLADSFEDAFNNTEDIPEYIFAIQISPQDGTNEMNLFYASDPNGGRGDIDITEEHLALYEDDDARGDFFYIDSETGVVRTTKWAGDESTGANLPIIRLAEMYLTRAEGNLRAGTTIGATPLEDVNTIRERAELDPLDAVTVEDVLRERKLELAFEGHQLHDLRRTGRSIGNISYDANRLVYPVPERELDANPNLTQNPGYGS